jgi:diacylglycerol kinase (ATP)
VRALLVTNRLARRGPELGDVARSELQARGIKIDEDPSARGLDAIVVAGGDGTLARQIPHAMALGIPIGLVPLGTFNDVARTLAIPLDVIGACAVIAAGQTRAVDVAHVNGVYYLTEASIGISARIARLQRSHDKQRFGVFALAASTLRAARHLRPFHAEVAYDRRCESFRTVQLTVANGPRFGGFIDVEGAAIDDGRLDLYAVTIDSVSQLFSVASAIMRGRPYSVAGLRTASSTAFDVETRRPHHITADGEPAGQTPARFEILSRALRIFSP